MVAIVATVCFFASDIIGYRIVALILLMTVSFLAMLFEIGPVLIVAMLSAVIWNFFFIPPLFTFHIDRVEDVLMFMLYFVIAMVHAVLTIQIRKVESKVRDKEEKENTIKLYNTLLNSLSHELRTPISTIVGAVDTLKEQRDKLTIDQQTELLMEIDKAGFRLNRQVENLLNMSRLETGMLKPNPDWLDVNELINTVLQKLDVDQNRVIHFTAQEDLPLLYLDAGLFEQIVYNLVHNAVLYTKPGSTILVEVIYQSECMILKVEDNGGGFPVSQISFAFDKFYRLPNSQTGGSGLGLSIVKGFVEALNGTIELINNDKGGATFLARIPVKTSYLNRLKNE
jgi:two-component system sensor histidine kinase KdpD